MKTEQNIKLKGVNGISSYTNIIDRLGGVMVKYNKHRSVTALALGFFSSFFKVSLLYHLLFLEDVFNNSFWKICIKIPNYVEPGLNLLECIRDTSITLFHPFVRHFLKYRILTITKSSNLNEQSSFFVCDTTQHRATL